MLSNVFIYIYLGTSQEGITLLQRFLDQTGDVQSASLLAVRAFPPEVIKLEESNQVSDWLNRFFILILYIKIF